jgi:hypothetical protein
MFQMNWFMDQVKKGYRPEQVTMNLLESRMKGTPMGDNLIKLAREGNGAELERIARNLAAQRGIDFDKEFTAFRKKFGL